MLNQSPKSPMIMGPPIHMIGVITVVGESKLEERRSSDNDLSAPVVTTKDKDTALSRVSHVLAGAYTPRRFALITRFVGYATPTIEQFLKYTYLYTEEIISATFNVLFR
ncbi:hypothetical protein M0804_013462 [Polistes exclamans]|nr:hypothetical protein M0804_013462 [Polistes exclamans]